MKEIMLTCPFTGLPFKAAEYADGKIVFTHPLTHNVIHMNFYSSINKYVISPNAFKFMEICTQSQAMEILEVTRQRVNKIAQSETIPTYTVAGSKVFLMKDVLQYKKTRNNGRAKKAKE